MLSGLFCKGFGLNQRRRQLLSVEVAKEEFERHLSVFVIESANLLKNKVQVGLVLAVDDPLDGRMMHLLSVEVSQAARHFHSFPTHIT
jgi:hypothetical protein